MHLSFLGRHYIFSAGFVIENLCLENACGDFLIKIANDGKLFALQGV